MRQQPARRAFDPRGARLAALVAAAMLLGGRGVTSAQRLPFQVFSADEGLPASQVWAVHADRRGLLWVGTSWGLARFDGRAFTTLSVPEGLPSPTVRTLLEDGSGALWIGTNAGLARFDGRQLETFGDRPEIASEAIWASAIDRHGQPWFGTEAGLVVAAGGSFRRYGAADGLPGDYVYGLFAAHDGALWIGTRGEGVARCRPLAGGGLVDCRIWRARDGLGGDVVRAFAEDRRGRILVGSRGGGITIFDGEQLSRFSIAEGLPSDDIYALRRLANGMVAVATAEQGLALCIDLEPGRCRVLREANGLPEDGVLAVAEDGEGSLWLGTESGLARLGRTQIWSYAEAEGLPDRQVLALAAAERGGLWVGTFHGLARLETDPHGGRVSSRWTRDTGLPGNLVWALERDAFGQLWVGTEAGLCRLEGAACEPLGSGSGMPRGDVMTLASDADGRLWAGTTSGVAVLTPFRGGAKLERAFGRADGLPSPRAYSVAVDGAGQVWVAHSVALSYFDGERFHAVGRDAGLPAHTVRGLGLARDGALLAGGYEHVSRHEPGSQPPRFRSWGRGAGLEGVLVLTAAELDSGRLLLGTNRGVLVLDPEARHGQGAVVVRYDRARGIVGAEVPHSEASLVDAAGRWWFGFKGGLSAFAGDMFARPSAPPAVEFVGLTTQRGRIFRAPFTAVTRAPIGWLGASEPELPHDDRDLRVDVRALSLRNPGDLRFQFRLAEDGGAWTEPRAEAFRDFTNLAPGRHVLEARVARAGGQWSEPARLAFVIRPAWWQSNAFRVLALLAFAGALAAAFQLRAQRAGRRTRELERQVAERTDDLARYAQALAEHLQTVDRAGERAQRAELARRELFARTSHELRTPLTAILGFSDLLERSLGDRLEAREQRYLANVRDGGEHLLRLVNDLLDQLKLEAGRMEVHLEEISLESMMESVVSLMEGFALHRGVRLESRLDGTLPRVRADVAKLRQVLLNLLSNAVKFSPRGETVSLSARPAADEEPASPRSYVLEVRDRGPGVPPDDLETIFEPYRQLAPGGAPVPGTGLGLAIARQMAELMGGRIEVESNVGQGATFRLVLPVDPQAAASSGPQGPGVPAEASRLRLLVVEPERERFAELARRLEREDLLAVRASSAAEAARMLVALQPTALAVGLDPTEARGWALVAEVAGAAAVAGVPLSILIRDDEGLGIALSLDAVIDGERPEEGVEKVVATLGARRAAAGRRQVVVVAAAREPGAIFAAALRRSGAEAFRIEGEREVLAAHGESPVDALIVDAPRLVRLAPEVGGGRTKPAIASGRPKFLLLGATPAAADFDRLASRLRAEGGEAGLALANSARALLERRVRQRPAAV